ncbi:MAG: DUF2141 domain-containing protein [Deltaproteobacteria bacterium]|nr:DUF2141 domain-containing protein [Deltaproteobacteria bacterium]
MTRTTIRNAVMALAFSATGGNVAFAQTPGTLEVVVTTPRNSQGHVGCALFSSNVGFPTQIERAKIQRHKTQDRVVCSFANLGPGRYAVAVVHDENNNGKLDTNMFGIPKEWWGTSNNVTHKLSAPTFEESVVVLSEGKPLTIAVKLHD